MSDTFQQAEAEGLEHKASEITYDEQFYPGRPRRLRPRARRFVRSGLPAEAAGEASADNADYVQWLVRESMLWDAKQLAIQLSGQGSMWQNPFAYPNPRAAVEQASVWFTAYPLSLITAPGESFLGAGRQDAVGRLPARSASTPSTPAR